MSWQDDFVNSLFTSMASDLNRPIQCNWCRDAGCLVCIQKKEKAKKEAMKQMQDSLIFTADINDPKQMEELKALFHADVVTEAASTPDGMANLIAKAKETMAKRSET